MHYLGNKKRAVTEHWFIPWVENKFQIPLPATLNYRFHVIFNFQTVSSKTFVDPSTLTCDVDPRLLGPLSAHSIAGHAAVPARVVLTEVVHVDDTFVALCECCEVSTVNLTLPHVMDWLGAIQHLAPQPHWGSFLWSGVTDPEGRFAHAIYSEWSHTVKYRRKTVKCK